MAVGTCGQPVRGGGSCALDFHHAGHHSSVAYVCDGCEKRHRGQPFQTSRDGEYADALKWCFLCARVAASEGTDYWPGREWPFDASEGMGYWPGEDLPRPRVIDSRDLG